MTEVGDQGEFKATGRNAKCYQEMPHEKDQKAPMFIGNSGDRGTS